MFRNVIEKVETVKRMVLSYFLSVASVYLTMSFLTNIFLTLINSFSISVI